jgi:hypothetical protein
VLGKIADLLDAMPEAMGGDRLPAALLCTFLNQNPFWNIHEKDEIRRLHAKVHSTIFRVEHRVRGLRVRSVGQLRPDRIWR